MALLMRQRGGRTCAAAIVCALALVHPTAGFAGDLAPGDELPRLELNAWDGTPTLLDPSASPVIVLETWASWCAPCRSALPELAALAKEFPAAKLRIAAVGVDRDRSAADRFLASLGSGASLPLYYDPEGEVPARLGTPAMPSTVLAVDGVVMSVDVGYSQQSWARLRSRIHEVVGAPDADVSDSHPIPQ